MNNFKKPADTVTLPAPYDVVSGAGALIGAVFGAAASNYKQGQSGEFRRTGQLGFTRATGTANTPGQKAYWDDTNRIVTPTASGNKLIGAFVEAHASGDTYAEVILIPTAS
jgi:predicted RecA/RadA family phage recombinase